MAKLLLSHKINVLCIIAVIYLQNSQIWANAKILVCKTPECQSLAHSYLTSMNKQINPCHNFYEYVCHGWGKQYPRPSYVDAWKTDELLEKRTYEILQRLLEDSAIHPSENVQSAKALYKACMNLPHMSKSPPNVVQNVMKTIGHWPMFLPKKAELPPGLNWWKIDNDYLKITGESALYNIHLMSNKLTNFQITTVIKQLSSPYGALHRLDRWQYLTSDRDNYISFLKKVIYTVAPLDPKNFNNVIETDLEDVVRFRESIKHIINGLYSKTLSDIKIKDAQKRFGMDAKVKENAKINWLEVIRHSYGNYRNAYGSVIQEDMLIVMETAYVQKLLELLQKTPKRRHLILHPSMVEDLHNSYNLIDGLADGYIRVELPRGQTCIKHHSMRKELTLLFTSHVLPDVTKNRVMQLMEQAKELLSAEISQSPWVSSKAKKSSVKRINNTTIIIGYPDSYNAILRTLKQPESDIQLDPLEPTAFYLRQSKILYTATAFLQPPNYSPHLPYVINYGTTVALFGHELQHLFEGDDLSDKHASGAGWTSSLRRTHDKKEFCFKKQYAASREREVLKHKLPKKVDLPDTTAEDVADVVGLKIAYKGYRKLLQQYNNVCPIIPGFEDIGCEKLFFIAFANTLCSNMSKWGVKFLLLIDNHSLPSIRLNNAVGNMKEFSRAFGCKPDDPLNFKKRCDMWSGDV